MHPRAIYRHLHRMIRKWRGRDPALAARFQANMDHLITRRGNRTPGLLDRMARIAE